ncbi:hypothetical protein C8T65DRAFT_729899 [Cerioporus squamosus]|nr:hypothetical protein C8T65DRAFT_729899 [Cerioporus squamosus]
MSQAEVVVVTCVIDSSLELAAEWPHILSDYLVPLLQRLGEHQFRMSFVGYGTADTRPTPILNKVFFNPPPQLLVKMREHPQELGIGQTGSGGGYGMAALEGLVAALEMYDTLKASVEAKPQQAESNVTCYLIHVASTPPDPAERPLWNMSPALDFVTWDTLSAEIRKRGIHYSNILLKQLPRFTELHASTAAGNVQTPWFTVRAPNVVHLTGFPQQQKGTKRPSLSTTTSVDRSPELKRAKMQPTSPRKSPAVPPAAPPPVPKASSSPIVKTASPPVPAHVPPAPTALPANVPQTSHPAPENSSIVTPSQLLDPAKRLEIQEKLRQAEQAIRIQMAHVVQLEKEGKTEAARQLRIAVQQRAEKLRLFKTQLALQVQQAQAQAHASASTQPGPGPSVARQPQPTATQLSGGSLKPDPGRPAPHVPQHTTPIMQNAVPKPPMPGQVTPDLAAQMQKLLEQKNKIAPSHSATFTSPEKTQAQARSQWLGTLTWRGFDSETHVRKDVHTRVVMVTRAEAAPILRIDTWPNQLSLAPSQHPAVPEKALHAWIQQFKWIPLSVQQAPASSELPMHEAKANEEHFRGLIRLLTEKNVYALAAWPNAAGIMENRLLLFVASGNRLVAGYFPQPGGVPELPKGDAPAAAPVPAPPVPGPSQAAANPFAGMPSQIVALLQQQMDAKQQAQFAKLPPEQKAAQQQQQHQQQQQQAQMQAQMLQQQQQQQGWMGGNPNSTISALFGQLSQGQGQAGPSNPMQNANANAMMAAMGMGGMGMGNMGNPNMGMNFGMGPTMGQQQQGGSQQGMHRRTPSAGNTMVSPEMLQSFMQRSQDGTGGGGSNGALGGMA